MAVFTIIVLNQALKDFEKSNLGRLLKTFKNPSFTISSASTILAAYRMAMLFTKPINSLISIFSASLLPTRQASITLFRSSGLKLSFLFKRKRLQFICLRTLVRIYGENSWLIQVFFYIFDLRSDFYFIIMNYSYLASSCLPNSIP